MIIRAILCTLPSLLSPAILPAQVPIKDPFVCGERYGKPWVFTPRQAKVATGRPSRLTALVIFAKFSNEVPEDSLAPPYAKDTFDPDLFGSLSHFYHHMSFGQFDITGTFLPKRYASLHDAAYYVTLGIDASREAFGFFNQEILRQADQDVDFGRFDNDGPDGIPNSGDDDGMVDFVFINLLSVMEGFIKGRATGVQSLGLHGSYVTDDPSVSGGFVHIRMGSTARVSGFAYAMGVMAHELGHWFGLPDLYDLTPGEMHSEDSAGIGNWGLMGRGATGWHGDDGPVPFCAWSRERLGWIGEDNENLLLVDRPMKDVEIEPVETGGEVYKMPISEKEYFLIEHRLASPGTYDRNIPGSGLLIWHIGPWASNRDERRKRVDLECADGLYADYGYPRGSVPDVEEGRDNLDYWARDPYYRTEYVGNLGDATDVFDGVRYTGFGPDTNPSSATDGGKYTGHRVEHIRRKEDRMVADLIPGLSHLDISITGIEDGLSEGSSGDGDGIIEKGETVRLCVEITNRGLIHAYGVHATLYTETPFIAMIDSTATYGDLRSGMSAARCFRAVLSSGAPALVHHAIFTIEMSDEWGHQWRQSLPYAKGILVSYELLDGSTDPGDPSLRFGNGDGVANPGELVGIRPTVEHTDPYASAPHWISLRSDDLFLRDVEGRSPWYGQRILQRHNGVYGLREGYFQLFIAPEAPPGYIAQFVLTIGTRKSEREEVMAQLEIRGSDTMPPQVAMVKQSPRKHLSDVGDEVTIICKFYGRERPKRVYLDVIAVPDELRVARIHLTDNGDGIYRGVWTVSIASAFRGVIVAEDVFGNRSETPFRWGWLIAPFEARTSVLLYASIPPGGASVYADVLDAIGIPYDLWNHHFVGSRGVMDVFSQYTEGLIIIVRSLSEDVASLEDHLRKGGHLLLNDRLSQWSSLLERCFYTRIWGVPSIELEGTVDDPIIVVPAESRLSARMLEGTAGDPITDGLPPFECARWERLVPIAPASSIIQDHVGYSYGVKVRTATYRGVCLSFDVESIDESEIRHVLLGQIVEWLMPPITSCDLHRTGDPPPVVYALHPSVPNPFNTMTAISYDLPESGRVRLIICNLLGQVVRTLVDVSKSAGHYTVCWDGTDDTGRAVASGVYLCRMVAGEFCAVRKLVLIE